MSPELDNEDLHSLLPAPDWNAMLRAIQQSAAAPPPGPVRLPLPSYPGRLGAGGVRWTCEAGCGWTHDENPGAEVVSMRIVLPAGAGGQEIADALSAQAAERHGAMIRRVEEAFAEHYATVHPAGRSTVGS